jgi:alkylhydroperoxidase family enzyme
MADVGGRTLMMAIQAVADAIAATEARLADGDGDALDETEMLLAYTAAADELRSAYEVARLNTSNLPPYDELVHSNGG